MEITSSRTYITILRLHGDPPAKDESHLLFQLKRELNRHIVHRSQQFIKKRMWRDGHLVDDTQQYIRTRDGEFMLYDGQYAIRNSSKEYNKYETVTLMAAGDVGQHIKIGKRKNATNQSA